MKPRSNLTPKTNIRALVRDPLFESLDGLELPIYLKLVCAWGEQKSRRVKMFNAQLYRDSRTAVRVLHQLEERGLIKLHYKPTGRDLRDREIEIV